MHYNTFFVKWNPCALVVGLNNKCGQLLWLNIISTHLSTLLCVKATILHRATWNDNLLSYKLVSLLSYLHRSDFVSESCPDSGVNVHPYDRHLMRSGLGDAVHRRNITQSAGVKQNLFVVNTLRPVALKWDIVLLLK